MKPSLAKYLRAQAILQDLNLSELVEKSLIAYLPAETTIKKEET